MKHPLPCLCTNAVNVEFWRGVRQDFILHEDNDYLCPSSNDFETEWNTAKLFKRECNLLTDLFSMEHGDDPSSFISQMFLFSLSTYPTLHKQFNDDKRALRLAFLNWIIGRLEDNITSEGQSEI